MLTKMHRSNSGGKSAINCESLRQKQTYSMQICWFNSSHLNPVPGFNNDADNKKYSVNEHLMTPDFVIGTRCWEQKDEQIGTSLDNSQSTGSYWPGENKAHIRMY